MSRFGIILWATFGCLSGHAGQFASKKYGERLKPSAKKMKPSYPPKNGKRALVTGITGQDGSQRRRRGFDNDGEVVAVGGEIEFYEQFTTPISAPASTRRRISAINRAPSTWPFRNLLRACYC
jgi:hypothetical protein